MSILVPIGDFSRMTHLSVKALRFYHDQGLLEPARIDPATGYRFYDSRQVPVAQVIRRFRDLDMPLDQVKAVLRAPDVETRTKEIIAHLTAMETKLAEMQMSVASLRALLEGPPVRAAAEFRSIPAAPALAVRDTVSVEAAWAWGADVFGELYGRLDRAGVTPAGPGGALFPAAFFELEEAELTALAALLACPRLVPESRAGQGARFDLAGVALITACLVAVVLPLVDGRQAGWPAWSWAALGSAVPLAIAFAVHQRRKAHRGGVPLLNPRVFTAWPLRAGLITQTVFWCQQAAGYLVIGLYLQQGRGLSALAAGAVFTFLAAGYLITSFQAPALTVRFGRRVIAIGAVVAAAGDAALYLATAHGGAVAWLFPGLLLLGAGQGLCITPLTTTVLSHADPATAGSVSGALSTAQQVGNSIGVAVTGLLFFGALGHGYGPAFEHSVLQMGALLLVVAALTRLMPARTSGAR